MATTANNCAEHGGLAPAASLSEQIAEHLAREIITGRLGANARIQELRVADDLGVSRGSVREALLILESRHLIDLLPRRGAIVRAPRVRDARHRSLSPGPSRSAHRGR